MYGFLRELNKYSVGRDYEQTSFLKKVYDAKLNYLSYVNYDNINALINPVDFQKLNLTEEKIEDTIDVTGVYPVSLEDEKNLIKQRADNINFLREMNSTFELCRNICKVPDSRMRNIQFLASENQKCVTDCLNVRTELSEIKKPYNNEKVFVWLA